jgi:hypothetical protein
MVHGNILSLNKKFEYLLHWLQKCFLTKISWLGSGWKITITLELLCGCLTGTEKRLCARLMIAFSLVIMLLLNHTLN